MKMPQMAAKKKYKLEVSQFLGSVNQTYDETLIPPEQALYAENVVVEEGTLKRCNGNKSVTLVDGLGLDVTTTMTSIFPAHTKWDIQFPLVSSAKKIYTFLPSTPSLEEVVETWTTRNISVASCASFRTSAGKYVGCYTTKGEDDGTAITLESSLLRYYDSETPTLAKLSNGMYFNKLCVRKDRLWAIYRYDGTNTYTNKVRVCKTGDPTTWTPGIGDTDPFEITVEDYDADNLLGLWDAYDSVIVFSGNSIHRITGTKYSDISVYRVATIDGGIVAESIQFVNNVFFFLTKKNGMYYFDGSSTKPWGEYKKVRHYIDGSFLSGYTYDDITLSCIAGTKYVVYRQFASGNIKRGVICEYDFVLKLWDVRLTYDAVNGDYFTIKSMAYIEGWYAVNVDCIVACPTPSDTLSKPPLLYLNQSGYHNMETGAISGGGTHVVKINSLWQSGVFGVQTPGYLMEVDKLYLTANGDVDKYILFKFRFNGGTWKTREIKLTAADKYYEIDLGNASGNRFEFAFQNYDTADAVNSDGCYFEIKSPVITYALVKT